MDYKLLLVQVITLLYRESQLDNRTANSAELVGQIVASIRIPETSMETDRGRETLVGLRATAMWMAGNPPTQDYDRTILLQRIRVNVADEDALYQAFEGATEPCEDLNLVKRMVLEYRSELQAYLNQNQITEIFKQASQKALFNPHTIDWKNFVKDVIGDLEPLATVQTIESNPAIVDSVDINDDDAVQALMEQAQDELSADGVLRTGWQGINRMCGDQGGFRRGEFILLGALQHQFKTGFTLNLFKHMCIYNKPYMRDPLKKPLGLHISAENNLLDNVMQLYVSLKENETGEAVSIRGVDTAEASAYVKMRLRETGYEVRMLRVDPSLFGYRDLFDLIQKYESEGYEVHFCILDYLNMLSKRGCQQGPHGFETRDLFRRVRNFTAPRGITFLTPHQLSTQAKELVRSQIENFVQEIANKGYYDSCRTVDQEVDMEISIHIEKMNGESWLTCQRGKHRKISITPEKDLYCVLPFSKVGNIRDDIHGADRSVRKVGGRPENEGGSANVWWETQEFQKAA
ncbi:hypothetical protein D3C85_174620 [compost metagenome]